MRIKPPATHADNTEGLFTFTGVFEEETTQQDVYEVTTAPLVQAFLAGVNSMVMAYGKCKSRVMKPLHLSERIQNIHFYA